MATEIEKIAHPGIPHPPKKEKGKEEEKSDWKKAVSKSLFIAPTPVYRFLRYARTKDEKKVMEYIKENFEKFKKIAEKITNTKKTYPFEIEKVNGKETFLFRGLPPQTMPLEWYDTHNYFADYPVEKAVKEQKNIDPKEVVWKAIRYSIKDENSKYGEFPNLTMLSRRTKNLNVVLAQSKEGREFLKELVKGFCETAQAPRGREKIRKGVFSANGKEYPAGVVVDMGWYDNRGGAFCTTEKAFENFIKRVEEINPYYGYLEAALFVTGRRELDAPLSEVYKYVAEKEIDAMERKLRTFDPNGTADNWEELKKVEGMKEFFKKVYQIVYKKINKHLMNMLWDSKNIDAFVIYFLPDAVLGDQRKLLNEHYDHCSKSISEHIGAMVHGLKEKYGIDISKDFEPVLRWNIAEIYKRDVGKELFNKGDVQKDKNLEKLEKVSGLSPYARIAIAAFSSPPIAGIIGEVAPKLVNYIGSYLVQAGIGNDPHTSGMAMITAGIGYIIYKSAGILFGATAEKVEEKEYEKRAEKTDIVTKDGKMYETFNRWCAERLPEIIEENKWEIYQSIRDWMLNYAIPKAREWVEVTYKKVKEAEEKGYIPRTTREIWQNYHSLSGEAYEVIKENGGLKKDSLGLHYYTSAENSFLTAGEIDLFRIGK